MCYLSDCISKMPILKHMIFIIKSLRKVKDQCQYSTLLYKAGAASTEQKHKSSLEDGQHCLFPLSSVATDVKLFC